MRSMIKEAGVLLFLGINAWTDIRKKEVSLFTVLIFALGGMLWSMMNRRSAAEAAVPLTVGFAALAFALLAEGAMGMGDAWILLALGTVLGSDEFVPMMCLGVLFAGGWAMLLTAAKRAGRKTEIPFVPFLLAGYVGGLILW